MATKRKAISKKMRFEVFKRDKFTCQYCGRSVPDVVLQIDHIKPVAKGGDNNIMNLITTCWDCNIGKGARELSDDSIVKKQQKEIQKLAEKNEQLTMMLEWRDELEKFNDNKVNLINDYIEKHSDWRASKEGEKRIKKWLKEFSLELILDAIDIAYDKYYEGTQDSWCEAFEKVSGICVNKNFDINHGKVRYYYNYLVKACINKYGCWNEETIHYYVDNYIQNEQDFEKIKSILRCSRYWSNFKENTEDYFENL